MKNYEYIMKDLDNLIEFITENGIILSCDICNKYGLNCENECYKNAIEYLKMDRIKEIVPENELPIDKFNEFLDEIRNLKDRINNSYTYTGTNYIRNHMKGLEDKHIVFNNNQKELLSKEFQSIDSAIKHLESLREIIEKYK